MYKIITYYYHTITYNNSTHNEKKIYQSYVWMTIR